ncbi:hypothetical protein [Rhabdothermincola salaria]|uniref:hypothetical protein n=1 Tax=Rhabdothermincola salaria TaxID=2903142 RepID=UPI001E590B91|nr:hypothetical protein [Rhabdothermincola salaria]MCD9625705.1 hypothetical protein [Rhabdothermincola salaria]
MTSIRTRTLRIVAATALTVGLAGSSTAVYALTPAPDPGPTDLAPGGNGPDDPGFGGPDDLTTPTTEPECHPFLATCDLAPNPEDPGDPGDPEVDDGGPEVDDGAAVPVVVRPTFTG